MRRRANVREKMSGGVDWKVMKWFGYVRRMSGSR